MSSKAMEVNDDEEDPIPNELDKALVHLIPAVTACGSDPELPTYLDLATFERLAGPALGGGGGGAGGKDGSGSKRSLDARVSGEIEVAFRHCMHEAGLALVGAETGGGGGSSGAGERGGGRRSKRGKAAASSGSGSGGSNSLLSEPGVMTGMMSPPMGILSLALEFVWNEAGLNNESDKDAGVIASVLATLPMVLLEDFLESQASGGKRKAGAGVATGRDIAFVPLTLISVVDDDPACQLGRSLVGKCGGDGPGKSLT